MKKRVIGALSLAIIGIPTFLVGGIPFKILCVILGLLALREIFNLKESHERFDVVAISLSIVSLIVLVFLNPSGYALFLGLSYQAIAFCILSLLIPTIFVNSYKTKDAIYLMGFTLLLGMLFNSVIMLYESNKWILLYIVLVSMSTDIFAYLIGSLIGCHKVSKISPNKSIEGCIAGSLCATIIGTFYYLAVVDGSHVLNIIILTLIISLVSQMGDIFFSKIKRENGIKDFSKVIVGHGGILDRLDSLIFAILVYIILCTIL